MTDNDKPTNSGDSTREPKDFEVTEGTIEPKAETPGATDPEVVDWQERAAEPQRTRGTVSYQDESTTAREPTLAERRARRKALDDEREAQYAIEREAARKKKLRKRILIGSGVTVGVVAVVAVIYAAVTPDEVTAQCVANDDQVIQSDENLCDENYVRSQGGYSSGGFFFIPIGGGGYRQYGYNYGGSGVPGQRVSGGSSIAPSGNTNVKTASGKSVQRGGLGVNSSSGGKSGGS
ncbi:hypothetical protein [Actinokineospora sp.]|uniref:hypothetical protein n=1 Tax=Actinokineospora sp. TaxID=1872133 RepID=UPI004037ADC6